MEIKFQVSSPAKGGVNFKLAPPKAGFQIALCSLFLLLASKIPCLSANASERLFLWNEANAIMASANTPEEYLIAAQAFQSLIDKGICNGPVCYNLGTALLNAGRCNSAIDALSRAERYLGSCADIQRNMNIAMARMAKREGPHVPWYRIVLFWHFRLSSPTRLIIAVAAFSVFWLIMTLRVLGVRRRIKSSAVLSLFIFVLFGSSVATSWQQEANAKRFSLLPPSEKTDAHSGLPKD